MLDRVKKGRSIRYFKISPLNVDANDYVDLIRWENIEVTQPTVTSTISKEILKPVKYNV